MDIEGELAVAEIQAASKQGEMADKALKSTITIEKLKKDWENMSGKNDLDEKKHEENVRHNKTMERFKTK